jgi:hypothetical protein
VKVGTDRANAPYVPDGVTAAELREELFSMIARSGVLPTAMSERLQRAESLLEHQGVVNRGDSREGNNYRLAARISFATLAGPPARCHHWLISAKLKMRSGQSAPDGSEFVWSAFPAFALRERPQLPGNLSTD